MLLNKDVGRFMRRVIGATLRKKGVKVLFKHLITILNEDAD